MALSWAWTARVDASLRARPALEPWQVWLAAVSRFDPPQSSWLRMADATPAGTGDGHAGSFEAFLQAHEREVWGYLWRMTGDEQAAYDLAQEAFVRAWQRFAQVSRYDRPKAWLFRVATNLALNHLRSRATQVAASALLTGGEPYAAADLAQGVAERDVVRQALLELPPRQRAALVLREVHEMPCGEVARALGISTAAAKMLLFRARESFRASYTRQEGTH